MYLKERRGGKETNMPAHAEEFLGSQVNGKDKSLKGRDGQKLLQTKNFTDTPQ